MISIDATAFLSPLNITGRLSDAIRSVRYDSLIEYTRPTRVEPIALIDHTISDLPMMKDLTLSLTSLYAAYYLQAVAVSTQINNVEVIRILDKLNPSRDPVDSFGSVLSLESKQPSNNPYILSGFGLESKNLRIKPRSKPAVEAVYSNDHDEDQSNVIASAPSRETQKQVADLALNLSTGIMLNVEVSIDEHTATIPVTVRLITTLTDPEVQKQMILYSAKDKSLKARYMGYRTGELSIKDLMFATDLIDAHREGLLKDNSGKYAEIIKRKNKNRLSGMLSMNPSVNVASNIMVMSKDNADLIEGEIGGKLSNYKLRQRIFKDTYLILMVVVDPRWEQVTIYHRGIPTPTDIGFKDLKNSRGGNNLDMTEILKSYQLGRNPTF